LFEHHDSRYGPLLVAAAAPHVHLVIVGAGLAGLAMAIRLRQTGTRDFVVLERASEVGGVWRDNVYPGCTCDVRSDLYSLSFAPRPGWCHAYAPGDEIQAYVRELVVRFGLAGHLRLAEELLAAAWDARMQRWRVTTSRGELTADVLVGAGGGLSEPAVPALPGIDQFGGASFHSARWDHACALAGRRVGVIGTGASAIQFVPQIQPRVARLHLFQRTPPWIVPRGDVAFGPARARLFGAAPVLQRLVRGAIFVRSEAYGTALLQPRLAGVGVVHGRRDLAGDGYVRGLRARLTPP
jgi:cation diffusion facilitator CzcD-associated flavoprotein CzcO